MSVEGAKKNSWGESLGSQSCQGTDTRGVNWSRKETGKL